AQEAIGRDAVFHSSLPAWIAKVKAAAKGLPVLKGERRTPKVRTGRVHLYSDVLSSRARVKRLNARAECALQRWAEPFSAIAWCLGRDYPSTLLDAAWTTLLNAMPTTASRGAASTPLNWTCETVCARSTVLPRE
ncbi:MAG TPA: hypothetical protein PKZ25_05260, partial [Candidatus Hydrogenedentes bacterium]|nr:hypothetical protein [Candidatus Hydrogenedentota bacterium]